jgi:hypothetical protein
LLATRCYVNDLRDVAGIPRILATSPVYGSFEFHRAA